jgi:hypothetical protein
LPAESRKQLIEEGYLKWSYADLNDRHRDAFTEIVELFLKLADEMGFGGKATPRENTKVVLEKSHVGFAVVDFPNAKKAITFYVLIPQSPVPLGVPIVPEDPKDFDPMTLGLAQFEQLKQLAEKPDSIHPISTSKSRLKPPVSVSPLDENHKRLLEIRQLQGHTGPVKEVAFSPDGKLAVSGSGWPNGDRTVRLWNVETGEELRVLGTLSQAVMTVGFSPNGKLVAAGGFDGHVHVWNVETKAKIATLPSQTEVVEDVVFSPDSQSLLSVGHKRAYVSEKTTIPDAGVAVLWNLQHGSPIWQKKSTGWFKAAAFSPDGGTIYLAGFYTGEEVHVLDAKTGFESGQFRADAEPFVEVEDLTISPDGKSVTVALVSGSVRVWNANAEGKPRERKLDPERLLTIDYTPDGSYLLTGGASGNLHVLDAKTLEPVVAQVHPSGNVWSVASAPDSRTFLSVGGSVRDGKQVKNNGDYAIRLWQRPESTQPANRPPMKSNPD